MRGKWMVPVLLSLLVLGACPKDEEAATPTTAQDACTVVGLTNVETALARDFNPGTPLTSGASRGCQFDATDGSGTVQVFISQGTNEAGYEQLKASYPDPEDVPGVGDDAAWSDRLHTFMAIKDTAVVIVSLNLNTDVDQLQWAKDVANAALARVKT